MDDNKKPKKPLIYYYITTLLIVMLLNAFLFPSMKSMYTEEVDYGKFISMLENKEIKSVEVQSNEILFTSSNPKSGKVYVTGKMDDPDLVNRLESAGVTFSKSIPKESSPILNFILTWIGPILIFFLLGQMFSKMITKRMSGPGAMQFGKSNAKVYVEAQTGKTFNDVAGQDEAKEALTEIVDFLNNPDKYRQIGAKMPKGALLVGPPGTGKTLLAKAVAGEANVPFFSISGSEFVEMFVGMGAARVRDLFKQAQEKAPCIVFIDEIDTIGKKRDSGSGMGGNDEREQTLNQLLTEMDGFDGGIGVVILAATNRPESLDKALLRPGRFDRRIPVEMPDLAGRESILKVHAKNIKTESNIDFNVIARATSGASGAELANIVNEAAIAAVKDNRNLVSQKDLEEAVEVVIAGYQRKGAVISDKEKKIIAYHEIGHALVAAIQTNSDPVHKITIIPRTSGALGYTMQVSESESVLMSKEEAFNKITTFTGGRAAEEIIFNICTSGASNDIEQATKIARAMVTRFGMSDKFGMVALETVNNPYLGGDTSLTCSSTTAAKVDEEVLSIIKEAHKKASKILSDNLDKLHELSNYLLEKETITGQEFMKILNDESVPEIKKDNNNKLIEHTDITDGIENIVNDLDIEE